MLQLLHSSPAKERAIGASDPSFPADRIVFLLPSSQLLVVFKTIGISRTLCYCQFHDPQNQAIHYFSEANSYSSTFNPILTYNLALTYAELGEIQKAFDYVEEIFEKNPLFPALWPLRSILSYQLTDHSTTLQIIKKAQELYPDDFSLLQD